MPDIATFQREAEAKYRLQDLQIDDIPSEGLGWLTPFPANVGDDILRQELEEKGVILIRGVMPPELVLDMRRKWFEHTAPSGVLRENTDPAEGIFCGADPDDFVGPDNAGYLNGSKDLDNAPYYKLSAEAHWSDWAVGFASNRCTPWSPSYTYNVAVVVDVVLADLADMVHRLQPEWRQPHIFRRQLYRANMPNGGKTATGVHYDHIFLRGGPPTALTAWVPIGDCTPQQGGLMYLDDSRSLGEKLEAEFTRKASEAGLSEEETLSAFNKNMTSTGMLSKDPARFAREVGQGRKWLIGDYKAGDAVFHHSYVIHAASANRDPQDRIRLSADLRFADKDAPHEERWSKPWAPGDGL